MIFFDYFIKNPKHKLKLVIKDYIISDLVDDRNDKRIVKRVLLIKLV